MLSPAARGILDRGVLCHVASVTPSGPHLTPLVFAVANDRIWVTTSRGSTKARSWRRDNRVAGLVRDGTAALSFAGRVRWHDALEPGSWLRSALEGPLVALASARFTRKNARFFAGYAVDARRVPLAWTPPGRVFAELRVERWIRLEGDRPVESWGEWGSRGAPPRPRPGRAAGRREPSPIDAVPEDLRSVVATGGEAALAVDGQLGPIVMPVEWRRDGDRALVSLPRAIVDVAPWTPGPAALEVDRASSWRASEMAGAMLRGAIARGTRAREVSLEVERIVWWRGWDSGTVAA